MAKNWRDIPHRGSVTEDPAIMALAGGPDPGREPVKTIVNGRAVFHYSKTRLHLDRKAWEALPPNGILAIRIEPRGKAPFTLALTRQELEATFGEVRKTNAWNTDRGYQFPKLPPAAEAFRVCPLYSDLSEPKLDFPKDLSAVEWAQALAERAGAKPESREYLERVSIWRQLYRPKSVKILLLGESHSAEAAGDLAVRVNHSSFGSAGYVRLIYCPGYGESRICSAIPKPNAGTPFWALFAEIARALTGLRRYVGSDPASRLDWKLEVLEILRDHGIWLEDAMVAGVYEPGQGRRYQGALYRDAIRESFHRFVLPAVAGEPILQTWTLGRTSVAPALAGLPLVDMKRVLPLPGWQAAGFQVMARKAAQEIAEALKSRAFKAGAA